jgi:hypothetical protein
VSGNRRAKSVAASRRREDGQGAAEPQLGCAELGVGLRSAPELLGFRQAKTTVRPIHPETVMSSVRAGHHKAQWAAGKRCAGPQIANPTRKLRRNLQLQCS